MGFPSSGSDASTVFGAVGVDEALYALKERSDVPLPILMRGLPERLVAPLSLPPAQDEAGEEIQASRVHRALTAYNENPSFSRANDMTRQVRNRQRDPIRTAWGLLLFVGLFAAVFRGVESPGKT